MEDALRNVGAAGSAAVVTVTGIHPIGKYIVNLCIEFNL